MRLPWVRGISTAGSFAPPSCVAPAQPFCIATGISAPTTSPGYVPLQGVASADSRPSLQPPSLEELPDPEAIERQKHGYARSLDQQLEDGKTLIAEESNQQKEQLYQAAKQLKLEYSTRLELAVQKAELELDRFARQQQQQQQQMPILPHSSSARVDTMDGTVAALATLNAAPTCAATPNQTSCVEPVARCMTSTGGVTAPSSPASASGCSMPFRTRQAHVGSPASCLTRTASPAPILVAAPNSATIGSARPLSPAAGSARSCGMLRMSLAASPSRCGAVRISTAGRGQASAAASPVRRLSPSTLQRHRPVATYRGGNSSCGANASGPGSINVPSSTRLPSPIVRHSMPGGVLGAAC